jgi:hypothetical protein
MVYLNKERTFSHISRSCLKIFDMIQVPYRGATYICRHRTKFVRHGDRDLCFPDLKDRAPLNSTDDLFPTPRNHNVSATETRLPRLAKTHQCSFKQRKQPTTKTFVKFKARCIQLPLRLHHYEVTVYETIVPVGLS